MGDVDGGWERRNGGLFLFPHRSMREAAAAPAEPEIEDDEAADE